VIKPLITIYGQHQILLNYPTLTSLCQTFQTQRQMPYMHCLTWPKQQTHQQPSNMNAQHNRPKQSGKATTPSKNKLPKSKQLSKPQWKFSKKTACFALCKDHHHSHIPNLIPRTQLTAILNPHPTPQNTAKSGLSSSSTSQPPAVCYPENPSAPQQHCYGVTANYAKKILQTTIWLSENHWTYACYLLTMYTNRHTTQTMALQSTGTTNHQHHSMALHSTDIKTKHPRPTDTNSTVTWHQQLSYYEYNNSAPLWSDQLCQLLAAGHAKPPHQNDHKQTNDMFFGHPQTHCDDWIAPFHRYWNRPIHDGMTGTSTTMSLRGTSTTASTTNIKSTLCPSMATPSDTVLLGYTTWYE